MTHEPTRMDRRRKGDICIRYACLGPRRRGGVQARPAATTIPCTPPLFWVRLCVWPGPRDGGERACVSGASSQSSRGSVAVSATACCGQRQIRSGPLRAPAKRQSSGTSSSPGPFSCVSRRGQDEAKKGAALACDSQAQCAAGRGGLARLATLAAAGGHGTHWSLTSWPRRGSASVAWLGENGCGRSARRERLLAARSAAPGARVGRPVRLISTRT